LGHDGRVREGDEHGQAEGQDMQPTVPVGEREPRDLRGDDDQPAARGAYAPVADGGAADAVARRAQRERGRGGGVGRVVVARSGDGERVVGGRGGGGGRVVVGGSGGGGRGVGGRSGAVGRVVVG